MTKLQNNTNLSFGEFQAFVKNECEQGRCTKQEAVNAILEEVIRLLNSYNPDYEKIRSWEEQEYGYMARNIN